MADADRDDVIPHFHMKAVYLKNKSEKAGRPIYEDREYVQILIPGNKTEMPVIPVNEQHKERWPDQYRRFKDKQEQVNEGTPLEQWPQMTPARVSALKDCHIFTVEQLANVPDSQAKSVGPDFQTLKKKAKAYLDSADGSVAHEQVEQLEERIKVLEAENEELRKNQKKKPGRPRKKAASKKKAAA